MDSKFFKSPEVTPGMQGLLPVHIVPAFCVKAAFSKDFRKKKQTKLPCRGSQLGTRYVFLAIKLPTRTTSRLWGMTKAEAWLDHGSVGPYRAGAGGSPATLPPAPPPGCGETHLFSRTSSLLAVLLVSLLLLCGQGLMSNAQWPHWMRGQPP